MDHTSGELLLLLKSFEKLKTVFPEFYDIIERNGEQIICSFRQRNMPLKLPLMIIAGAASGMDADAVAEYHDILEGILKNFSGTVISGGTTSGIPGLTGTIKSGLQMRGELKFSLYGYLPGSLPDDCEVSAAYDYLIRTDAAGFSVLELCTYWSDIILSGIKPEEVILIGINGGRISYVEYLSALELGAKVYLKEGSDRAADEILKDEFREKYPDLLSNLDPLKNTQEAK